MNADGSNVHRVIDTPADEPQWSRQGRIAFVAGDIFSISPDGSGLTQMTKGANGRRALLVGRRLGDRLRAERHEGSTRSSS